MKKKSLLLLSLVFLLPSCTRRGGGASHVEALPSPTITEASDDRVRVIGTPFVDPFNTSMSANLYYTDNQYDEETRKEIGSFYYDSIEEYHAYSDNHYDYSFKGEDGTYSQIVNLKTINESYGTGKAIQVSDYLYDLLTYAYQFTLNSEGKFNIFLGQLTSLYEDKLASAKGMESPTKTTLDCILQDTTNLLFDDFSESEKKEISSIVSSLPTTTDELKGLLTFDDTNKSVTFNAFYKNDVKVDGLKISLGGVAKGYATERVSDEMEKKYPGIALLLNSGTSSIKTIGTRPDDKGWNIRYNNPSYYEYQEYLGNPYNASEVVINYTGGFNISTSGYYENCFFSLGDDKKSILRRNHILNPTTGYSEYYFDQVSVFLDNTGLADMYTTCLMNCTSVEEAKEVFDNLNNIYHEKDAQLILCYKSKKNDPSSFYSYSLDQMSDLNESGYPSVKLSSGSIYQGDYSDFNLSLSYTVVSKMNYDYQENYYITSGLYSHASLLKDSSQVTKPVISVLQELK